MTVLELRALINFALKETGDAILEDTEFQTAIDLIEEDIFLNAIKYQKTEDWVELSQMLMKAILTIRYLRSNKN